MPVYTLNPSHKRSGSHKASRSPSLRERMTMRRNPGTAYNIYLDGKLIDVMPYYPHLAHLTLDEMRRKLVSDGYDPRITIKPRKERSKPAARSNPLSEDGAVVLNPNVMGNAIIWTPAGEGAYHGEILVSHDGGRRTQAPYMASVKRASGGWDWLIIGWASSKPLASGHAASLREAQKAAGAVAVPSHHMNPRRKGGAKPSAKRSGGRTAAQGNAAKAMKLYHSGQASSLAEAWQMVRGSSARRNPLSEDGAVVSNPRRKGAKRSAKRSGGRTAAQSNAAKAMKLFHSGKASSLAEAWDMVRRGR
jgi:hypothetical protein